MLRVRRLRSWQGMDVRRMPIPPLTRTLEALGFGLFAARLARREGANLTISFGRTADTDVMRCEGGAHVSYLEEARRWDDGSASALRAISPYHAAQCRMEAMGFRSPRLRLVAAISGLVADDIERRFAIPRAKIEVLYNGVDAGHFKPPSDPGLRDQVRRAVGYRRRRYGGDFHRQRIRAQRRQGTNRSLAEVGGTALPNRCWS